MITKNILSISLISTLFLSGCSATLNSVKGGPVKIKSVEKDLKNIDRITQESERYISIKNLDKYYFNIKPNETLGDIIRKIRKDLPQINLFVNKNVNIHATLGSDGSLHHITIFQYLDFLNNYYKSDKKFSLKLINNVYTLSIEKNEDKLNEDIQKKIERKTKENIKLFKKMSIEIGKEDTYSSFFSDLYDIYKIRTNLKLINQKDFLNKEIGFDYKGSLFDFIEGLKTTYDYGINYYGGITIYDHVNKTYTLKIPAIANDNSNLKSEKFNLYDSLEKQIDNVFKSNDFLVKDDNSTLSSIKESVFINKSAKTVSIVSKPSNLTKIDKIIDHFNKTYSKAIYFKISFINVEFSSDQGFGVDISGLMSDLIDKGLAKVSNNLTSVVSSTSQVLNPNTSFKIVNNKGLTKALFSNLNKYGRSKLVQTPSFISLNATPYFFNTTNKRDYIKEIKEEYTNNTYTSSTNPTTTTNSSKTLDVQTLETGFNLSILPYIDEKTDNIYVILNPSMKDLVSLESYTYESGSADSNGNIPKNTIQLPNIKELNLGNGQTIRIKNGETTIIGGFIIDNDSYVKEGLPGVDRKEGWLDSIFSTKSRTYKKSELIIIITATTLNE